MELMEGNVWSVCMTMCRVYVLQCVVCMYGYVWSVCMGIFSHYMFPEKMYIYENFCDWYDKYIWGVVVWDDNGYVVM